MIKKLLTLILAFGLVSLAWAQPIRIGQTVGLTGAVAGSSGEARDGALLYFGAVNAKGGINGRTIELVSLDDKFDVQLAVKNAQKLIDDGVLCLFLNRGTPHTQAIMPLLTDNRIPLVGPSTGAMVLHEPVHPWLFNVRAPYQREAERTISHLKLIGIQRIAIVQVDDAFGNDAAIGALKGLKDAGLKPVAHEKYNRTQPDFSAITPKLLANDPQAVLYLGSGSAIVSGMKALRDAGSQAQMITLSNNASASFVQDLGSLGRGVIVSQVFPYERSIATGLVKEALALAESKKAELTPAMLEGFVAAKVLVEGIRRAGPNPTRVSLRKALEGMSHYDAGGIELGYSATDHTGFDYADLSIIDASGRFKR